MQLSFSRRDEVQRHCIPTPRAVGLIQDTELNVKNDIGTNTKRNADLADLEICEIIMR